MESEQFKENLEEAEDYRDFENNILNEYVNDEHIYSFEGVYNNCYIRLSSSTINDLIKTLIDLKRKGGFE